MTALALVLAVLALAVAVGESVYATRQRRTARRGAGTATDQVVDALRRALLPAPTSETTLKPGALDPVSPLRVVDMSSVGGGDAPSSPPTDGPRACAASVAVPEAIAAAPPVTTSPAPAPAGCPSCDRVAEQHERYRTHLHRTKHAQSARP